MYLSPKIIPELSYTAANHTRHALESLKAEARMNDIEGWRTHFSTEIVQLQNTVESEKRANSALIANHRGHKLLYGQAC